MIRSFGDKRTEKIWKGYAVRSLSEIIQNTGRRKLRMIHNACSITDLQVPPSNRLEKLHGNYEGFYSIRINKQWRIIFHWVNMDAYDVRIIDYH
jgi:proteic killer suppression protein